MGHDAGRRRQRLRARPHTCTPTRSRRQVAHTRIITKQKRGQRTYALTWRASPPMAPPHRAHIHAVTTATHYTCTQRNVKPHKRAHDPHHRQQARDTTTTPRRRTKRTRSAAIRAASNSASSCPSSGDSRAAISAVTASTGLAAAAAAAAAPSRGRFRPKNMTTHVIRPRCSVAAHYFPLLCMLDVPSVCARWCNSRQLQLRVRGMQSWVRGDALPQ